MTDTQGVIRKEIEVMGYLEVVVGAEAPTDWLSRCFSDEWKNIFYTFRTENDVYEHLAHNALTNGVTDISRLDGWADVPYGAVRLGVDVEVDIP